MNSPHQKEERQRSFPETLLAVAWSFIGLRRKRDFDQDVGRLNPIFVIVAGLLGTAVLIALLLAIAHRATS